MKEFNALYLQKYFSRNTNPLKGRLLYERFRADSNQCRLGYILRPDKDSLGPDFQNDLVSYGELDELKPDVIFVEGGLIEGSEWRMPEEVIAREVSRGATVFISDIDWNILNQQREEYRRVRDFCRVSIAYSGDEPVEVFDPVSFYEGEKQIVCNPSDIAYEPWLSPVYDGLPPFVVGNAVPIRGWVELVATCNRSTTQCTEFIAGLPSSAPNSGAFAAATRMGLGFIVFISGNVSNDVWMEAFPGNLTWLTRLASHMVERVRIDRRQHTMSNQIFISNRHVNHHYAQSFGDELRRRGFGTWLDSRELLAGDELTPEIRRAISDSSHVAVMWSADCADSKWILMELDNAREAGKRIFVVRLDETPVPLELADRLRVEAQVISPDAAAKLVALSIEGEERRKAASLTSVEPQ